MKSVCIFLHHKKDTDILEEVLRTIQMYMIRTKTSYKYPIPEKKGIYDTNGQLLERVSPEKITILNYYMPELLQQLQYLYPTCIVKNITVKEEYNNQYIVIDWSKNKVKFKVD